MEKMGRDGHLPLFETKASKGRIPFGFYVASTIVGIWLICVYRVTHLPEEGEVGRWAWIGMFLSELWYILYWFVTLSVRWNPIYRNTFKDRLTQRSPSFLPSKTGYISIQCRGWKSIYFNPERKAFLGVAPTTLLQSLIQHKRWSEGHFQIFLSRYCPFIHGHKRIPFLLQLSYCVYLLWAPNCLATLYYVTIPPLCLLKGISLFPKV